jgi:two-component system, NarL family, response regulator NreC
MPAQTPKIKVALADDHAILRAGLKMLINAQGDMEVVSEASDGAEAIQVVSRTKPDVALIDLTMPRGGGVSALRELTRNCPQTRILVLTMHDDPAYLRAVFAAGAFGYVLKRSVDAELLAAIRAVHRGRTFVDPSMANIFVHDALATNTVRPQSVLSDRELQVLKLVALGHTSQEIANQIAVSVKTVETYRSRFRDKLGLQTRSDAVRFALEMGLLTAS